MNTYTTHYESWLSQLYFYVITSLLVDEAALQTYHDLNKEYWWEYYDMGLTARDAVKVSPSGVFTGWRG